MNKPTYFNDNVLAVLIRERGEREAREDRQMLIAKNLLKLRNNEVLSIISPSPPWIPEVSGYRISSRR